MAEKSRILPRTLALPRLPALSAGARRALLDWSGLVVAVALGLTSGLIIIYAPAVIRPAFDDSFITLTFARNLAEHGKLTYDGISWSTGATSPLHVAILAALIKLGLDPITTDVVFGVFCHAALAGAVYLFGWAVFRSRLAALLAGAAIAFMPYAALDSGNGLETSLFMTEVALAMVAFLLWRTAPGRLATGLLLAAAVLTRPEGAFLVPAVLVYLWLERPAGEPRPVFLNQAIRLAAPPAAALSLLLLYSLAVNETLGGTASAKLSFFQEDQQPFVARLSLASDQMALFASPLIPFIAFAAVSARRREALLVAIFWLPVAVAYTLLFPGGLEHYFFRYQHPVLPFLAVFAGGGAAYLLTAAAANGYVVKALVLAVLIVLLFPIEQQYERFYKKYDLAATETHRDLEAMAKDLNTILAPGQLLAAHDIGAAGYYGRYGVLDLVGLVNPQVIPYHDGRRLKQYIEGAHPDYLLMFPDWDERFLRIFPSDDPRRFELVKVYEGGVIRKAPYVLYRIRYD